ncbi:iron chelate uptake ABC transporter family permease subunit [Rhodobacteraceae bacterium F11138]|nr:iron chelate uptake ABC transporter family permease subunit [Rhodobacteraceae bacterium F11138]
MPVRRLIVLAILTVLACVLFLTWGARGDMGFVLQFRGGKLLSLLTVAAAIALSTMLFQTVTGNRILTPSIMGFDALFLLIQTALVWTLGGSRFAGLDPMWKFAAESLVMMAAALALFGTLLGRGRTDLNRMILTGVVLGIGLRSLTALLQRLIDPNEFAVVQSASFARFNRLEQDGLLAALCIVGLCALAVWRMRETLDVVELGRERSIGLGVDHDRIVIKILLIVAALVSVSTALAGPAVFVGLLVVSLTRAILPSHRHAILLPCATLIAALLLVLGQTLFERVLSMQSTLSVAIEFLGGLVFLFLIMRSRRS